MLRWFVLGYFRLGGFVDVGLSRVSIGYVVSCYIRLVYFRIGCVVLC